MTHHSCSVLTPTDPLLFLSPPSTFSIIFVCAARSSVRITYKNMGERLFTRTWHLPEATPLWKTSLLLPEVISFPYILRRSRPF